jgi:hypothetical protein
MTLMGVNRSQRPTKTEKNRLASIDAVGAYRGEAAPCCDQLRLKTRGSLLFWTSQNLAVPHLLAACGVLESLQPFWVIVAVIAGTSSPLSGFVPIPSRGMLSGPPRLRSPFLFLFLSFTSATTGQKRAHRTLATIPRDPTHGLGNGTIKKKLTRQRNHPQKKNRFCLFFLHTTTIAVKIFAHAAFYSQSSRSSDRSLSLSPSSLMAVRRATSARAIAPRTPSSASAAACALSAATWSAST